MEENTLSIGALHEAAGLMGYTEAELADLQRVIALALELEKDVDNSGEGD